MKLPELFYDATFWLPLLEKATISQHNDHGVNNRELCNGDNSIHMAYRMPEWAEANLYGTFDLFYYAVLSWSFDADTLVKYRYSTEGVTPRETQMFFPHDPMRFGNFGTIVPKRFATASLTLNDFIADEFDMDYLIHQITIFRLTLET